MTTWVVEVQARDLDENTLAARLRVGMPAVVGRLSAGKMMLDVRTVFEEQMDDLANAIERAVG